MHSALNKRHEASHHPSRNPDHHLRFCYSNPNLKITRTQTVTNRWLTLRLGVYKLNWRVHLITFISDMFFSLMLLPQQLLSKRILQASEIFSRWNTNRIVNQHRGQQHRKSKDLIVVRALSSDSLCSFRIQ